MIGPLEDKIKRDIWKEMGIIGSLEPKPKFIPYKKIPMQKVSHINDISKRRRISREITKVIRDNENKGNKNISRIGAFIYTSLFGGEVLLKDAHYKNSFSLKYDKQNFQPDVIRFNDVVYGDVYPEIKGASGMNLGSFCSKRQVEQYTCQILTDWVRDKNSFSEYVFFKYGHWRTSGINKIRQHNKMLKAVCNGLRNFLIIPFNLALFLFRDSNVKNFNQETSKAGGFNPSFNILGSVKTNLEKGLPGLVKLIEDYQSGPIKNPEVVDDLFLNQLGFNQTESPPLLGEYRRENNSIEPFVISKYSLDKKGYKAFRSHFVSDHKRILEILGLENILQMVLEGKERDYMESLRISAGEEGISFEEALEKYGPFKLEEKLDRGLACVLNEGRVDKSKSGDGVPF